MNSGVDDRLILDNESIIGDIVSVLDDVRAMRNDKYFIKALGGVSAQKLKDYDASIRKRLNDTFNIIIVGDFKRGKSTLINALLGKAVVPTAVTPETVTINKISYSETPKAEAVLKNGRRAMLKQSEIKRDEMEKLMERLPDQIDYVDIKEDAELLKDIAIIDTPGIGELLRAFDVQVADYLVNADAVIYVISARSPLSFTEQAFLSSAVMPQSFSRVFAVVNMSDTLETEENIEKVKKLTYDRVSDISENITIFMLSALDEFCRKFDMKRPEPELAALLENNFEEFEAALRNDIILQKDVIKSSRCVALVQMMLDDISARAGLVINSLGANLEKLTATEEEYKNQNSALMKNIEKHKLSLASGIDEMKTEAKDWLYDFMSKLKSEISSIGSSTDIHDIERYFQFYMMDTIKNAIVTCAQRHQKEVSDILTTDTKIIAAEISQNIFGGINTQIADCIKDISWTDVDSALFAGDLLLDATGLSYVVGPLYVVGQAVAGFIRQNVVSKKQADFLSPILESFDSITNDVIDNIDYIYDQMKNGAVDKLDELYQSQLAASLEAISQAKRIVSAEDTKKEEVIEYLNEVLRTVQGYKAVMKKYE